jgi:lysophospholipase L1-like esterase
MTRVRSLWLVLALAFGLLLPSAPVAAQATKEKAGKKAVARKAPDASQKPSTVTPAPKNEARWQKRHEQMNARVALGSVDLLMIGDSITQGWEGAGKQVWAKCYASRNAVNLGISGDQTQHVLWRLQNGNIKGISPKLAVLMIGTNNAGSNTPEEIAAGIKAIVETLRKDLPQTKVLILGIFPRGANDQNQQRQVNAKANEIACKLADGDMVQYLDIGKNFLEPDGTLTKEIMPDLLHLSPKGYQIWADSIEPVVAKVVDAK